MLLSDDIKSIKGIGDKTAECFEKLKCKTVSDLLHLYPRGYETFEMPKPVEKVYEGDLVSVYGAISNIKGPVNMRKVSLVSCDIKDPSGKIELVWFNQPYIKNNLHLGTYVIARGKVTRKGRNLVIAQPKLYKPEQYDLLKRTMLPVYSLTKGLTNDRISKAMKEALKATGYKEYLPTAIINRYNILSEKEVLKTVHFPENKEELAAARNSIAFREFFIFALMLRSIGEDKAVVKNSHFVPRIVPECEELKKSLPYDLTGAQERAVSDILYDMSGPNRMSRLIQGDVGSGKTIVSVLALLAVVKSGHQGALMAPTEVLANQHYKTFTSLLEPFGVKVELLVGATKLKEKKEIYSRLESGETDIVIGTHAIIQQKVNFKNLGLVITDEQHRFGVKQREAITEKGNDPHILVMSATPIPRSLALILYGDLDISVIDEVPKNRLPIKNCVVGKERRKSSYEFIRKEIAKGHQGYVICPMIEMTDVSELENVSEYAEILKDAIPGIRIDTMHGKLKEAEKEEIMTRFKNHETDLLVSTTVIEVGIDVPNATVIMIENAERFGLAQLHQLRGRVGRGKDQSYCIFINGNESEESKERLEVLNTSNDGFYIAEKDLELRGPGDFFGVKQSGDFDFKIGDIYSNSNALKEAGEAANSLTGEEFRKLLKNETIASYFAARINPGETI